MNLKLDVLIIQLANIFIVFWLFRKFIGSVLTAEIVRRKEAVKKLEHAEHTYREIVTEAEQKAHALFVAWVEQKELIIAEAKQVAQRRADEIVQAWHKKVEQMLRDATMHTAQLERELKEGFVDGVKTTTQLVVNKLFENDLRLEEKYVERLVAEFSAAH